MKRLFMLNVVLSLSNVCAIVPYRAAYKKGTSRTRLLLIASSLTSSMFHICDRSVRARGLPGLHVPYVVEWVLLQSDRVCAVALGMHLFVRLCVTNKLNCFVKSRFAVLASFATGAGITSEIVSRKPLWFALFHTIWHCAAYLTAYGAITCCGKD